VVIIGKVRTQLLIDHDARHIRMPSEVVGHQIGAQPALGLNWCTIDVEIPPRLIGGGWEIDHGTRLAQ